VNVLFDYFDLVERKLFVERQLIFRTVVIVAVLWAIAFSLVYCKCKYDVDHIVKAILHLYSMGNNVLLFGKIVWKLFFEWNCEKPSLYNGSFMVLFVKDLIVCSVGWMFWNSNSVFLYGESMRYTFHIQQLSIPVWWKYEVYISCTVQELSLC
jgi:hypothetical protein